jgi:hypothetical protein
MRHHRWANFAVQRMRFEPVTQGSHILYIMYLKENMANDVIHTLARFWGSYQTLGGVFLWVLYYNYGSPVSWQKDYNKGRNNVKHLQFWRNLQICRNKIYIDHPLILSPSCPVDCQYMYRGNVAISKKTNACLGLHKGDYHSIILVLLFWCVKVEAL